MSWRVPAIVCGAVGVGITGFVLWWPGIPNGEDAEAAYAILRHIREGHGGFLDLDEQREAPGKAIYAGPGVGGNTRIDIYEVTTPEEMGEIERLAREAIHATSGANSVRLLFYEKQNWRAYPNGYHERQPEKLLREVSFER